jgi:carbonic anhydrase
MDRIKQMMQGNREWAKSKLAVDPNFFKNMAEDQKPTYLWIGCCDSRVHPSDITNTPPGEIFVHRNVANLVVHTDMNLLSVLEYAVRVLQIPHVVVCGHYNCGGIRAALAPASLGILDNWVRNIKDVYGNNVEEIDGMTNETQRINRLVELNVMAQVKNLSHTSIVQKAWKKHQLPYIHGWVYDLSTGYLKEITRIEPGTPIEHTHRYDN